jgi:hypothetical protein
MRTVFQILSWLALAGTIVPSMMYLGKTLSHPAVTQSMLLATVVWFVSTPLWMGRGRSGEGQL